LDKVAHHTNVQNSEYYLGITETVDLAVINQRVFILPREISVITRW